ncbi:glutathione S-transferase [Roseomonas alkaliterrae]|uniref:Glutathione S-transferase n=1 Tax=Neoroseomonas alkaliterrae TaxID=1452450 RepID=A0A840Y0H0_9PROT|nr:glutathione S-transferase [Neoroseomonas alkaliterrae]MBB5689521.1 glutathione S-transferase [Neoroseomonas alkaliterrae]MBR0676559.1 glutathione S-transferase [Neoroseomonas alkaliterrae]
MKLHYSAASPYVRKVMACAIARGLEGGIEKITTNPHASPEDLLANNPLSKVPALLTPDGIAVFDSPVICEFLDSHGDAPPLFPPVGSPERLKALLRQATADGIMDAAVARRMQSQHPQDEARRAFDARQKAAVERALAALERDPPTGLADIGAISVACALGYLDFRFPHEPWREAHPRLAAWFAEVSKLRPIAETVPVG